MENKLKQYFPMIHERASLLKYIQSTPALLQQFNYPCYLDSVPTQA